MMGPLGEQPAAVYPDVLPDGCRRKMVLHLNGGPDGSSGHYTVHMPDGERLPISHWYNTHKGAEHPRGYQIEGVDLVFKTWQEVREYWPTFIALRSCMEEEVCPT